MKILNCLLLSIFFVILVCSGVNSYGEGDENGHPTYSERTALMAVNMARNNPYNFAHVFMPLFPIYTYSDYYYIYAYNSIAKPQKPLNYNSQLSAYADVLMDQFINNECDNTGLKLCNGTYYPEYLEAYYSQYSTSFIDQVIGRYQRSIYVEPGYGAIMNAICQKGNNTYCKTDSDSTTLDPRFGLNSEYINEFGVSSRAVGSLTYILYWAAPSIYKTIKPIPSASHIWINGDLHFYLTFYQPYNYPTRVSLIFQGNDRSMDQYLTPSSSTVYKNQPYSTYKYVMYLNNTFSDVECLTYSFSVSTYNGSTHNYPDTGYLTVSNDNSSCGAWTLTKNDPYESSSTTLSSLSTLLLFSISMVISLFL
ncbi:hypothetical protein DICPUDRAFT_81749 [Dictyostelium purpureum]|uniref:Uncharacterized protein n=1 Tax=Dictyostelium purpureum TaxID=5786 RepID=F0ZUG5_DICPU|nr:uncharacterized protein DICPUDRAFT_81749 [Dictyostelium purpureum]EGC32410.1 hypothetical protein DICPUDRAFT_81749 [Dictyostelium purpureum]|eukprot:XP_003291057.1 hypothetical protein DICPUDRAFT_81749 [Dictyostelium purpureum]